MRIVDLIEKKRAGHTLTGEEIEALIAGYTAGEIPDYQMSAFAMAVCFQGMTDEETTALTMAMAHSGETLDLSQIPGIKVDKHSTGGVGDTTTLVLGPLLAAVGVPVAKMSGRGLGHTGGTIDKLESIPGLQTQMDTAQFMAQVQSIGLAVAGQTAKLAPADKTLYALRDVTGTVQSIPLIASSIMSKKLASGADAIVLDVKVGAGAFMKTIEDARQLARKMVAIGQLAGRRTVAVLSSMEQPLGYAIGNALEVKEAIATLAGDGPADLTELCLALGSEMVHLANRAPDVQSARQLLTTAIVDGRATAKFKDFITAQAGDATVVDHPETLPQAPLIVPFLARGTGYVTAIDAKACGEVAMRLGAGRSKQTDVIDMAVGLLLRHKVGDFVHEGDALVEIHARSEQAAEQAIAELATGGVFQVKHQGAGHLKAGLQELVDGQIESVVLETIRSELANVSGDAVEDLAVEAIEDRLLTAAIKARAHAYVPYSQFSVGAALELADGSIVTGVNVENASYGLTNCAERTAIFRAVAMYGRENLHIKRIAIVADSVGPVAPCGACRQVLAEFCPGATPVVLANLAGEVEATTVAELLPHAFGPQQMNLV